ncbi:hypothetical protein C8J57DRAFT_1234088 [Mycena rebaudengoi]|nr:hypothetical protein C8J57DRAFT_1234088 [Mycena rebaudengoi]
MALRAFVLPLCSFFLSTYSCVRRLLRSNTRTIFNASGLLNGSMTADQIAFHAPALSLKALVYDGWVNANFICFLCFWTPQATTTVEFDREVIFYPSILAIIQTHKFDFAWDFGL